jgi:hypothetical protein
MPPPNVKGVGRIVTRDAAVADLQRVEGETGDAVEPLGFSARSPHHHRPSASRPLGLEAEPTDSHLRPIASRWGVSRISRQRRGNATRTLLSHPARLAQLAQLTRDCPGQPPEKRPCNDGPAKTEAWYGKKGTNIWVRSGLSINLGHLFAGSNVAVIACRSTHFTVNYNLLPYFTDLLPNRVRYIWSTRSDPFFTPIIHDSHECLGHLQRYDPNGCAGLSSFGRLGQPPDTRTRTDGGDPFYSPTVWPKHHLLFLSFFSW